MLAQVGRQIERGGGRRSLEHSNTVSRGGFSPNSALGLAARFVHMRPISWRLTMNIQGGTEAVWRICLKCFITYIITIPLKSIRFRVQRQSAILAQSPPSFLRGRNEGGYALKIICHRSPSRSLPPSHVGLFADEPLFWQQRLAG